MFVEFIPLILGIELLSLLVSFSLMDGAHLYVVLLRGIFFPLLILDLYIGLKMSSWLTRIIEK